MSRAIAQSALLTPEAVIAAFERAGVHVSERNLRKMARDIGACRQIGKALFFTEGDVDAILEASRPCPSKSTSEAPRGTTEALSPVGGYAALRKLRAKSERSASQQKEKQKSGHVISMARSPR